LTQEDINELFKRRDRLSEFKEALGSGYLEEWWQDFFERNKWIFGHGLNYVILRQIQSQPQYGGMHMDGSGGQKGDYLAATKGDISFTVLVEIKTPSTLLLRGEKEIRSGTWGLSKDLIDAVAQLQTNVDTWSKEGSKQLDNFEKLQTEKIYTVQPKGILVIGRTNELKGANSRHQTFERFRKSLHGIEILTFDEVYQRAEFIVEHKDS
jgi:Domain of unknown function (DUF4263)